MLGDSAVRRSARESMLRDRKADEGMPLRKPTRKCVLAVFLLAVACSLALPGWIGAGDAPRPAFGFADDLTKYADDGGDVALDLFQDIGVSQNRVSVFWDPANPDVIDEQEFLDRLVPQAEAHGVTLVFAVYSRKARGYTERPGAMNEFASFAAEVAQRYPSVTQFVIGNEPNQPRFWQPQFAKNGSVASAAAYTKLLARSYDALKAVNPAITVFGVGLSPRGNDRPKAPSNASVSPVRFIAAMGKAYRAMDRDAPLMDALSIHVYPNRNTDAPGKGYFWPGIGFPNLDRLKQAVWDAFHDTAQPVFAETGDGSLASDGADGATPLTLKIDEIGWQVKVGSDRSALYSGKENVPPVSEVKQATYYRRVVEYMLCDESIEAALFFHLKDESDLARFQSGVLAADGTPRASYEAVKEAVRGECPGARTSWKHRDDVIGAKVRFAVRKKARRGAWSMQFEAQEAFAWRAGLIKVSARSRSASDARLRLAIAEILITDRRAQARSSRSYDSLVWLLKGEGRAYWKKRLPSFKNNIRAGTYVYAVVLSAATNGERSSVFMSAPFRIGDTRAGATARASG